MNEQARVKQIISARERDLGGFSVRRILPFVGHRAVGPFVFFDHMGPARLPPGGGMDVRPHPHVGLATVTYLFEGRIHHRDSLGSDVVIEPGAVNWMTAGRGIVHSERTPAEDRPPGAALDGIQLWVALPVEDEECAPSFTHHPTDGLPELRVGDADVKLLLGRAFGVESPVPVRSNLYYAELKLSPAGRIDFATDGRETALYAVSGAVRLGEASVTATEMAILDHGDRVSLVAEGGAHVMVIGGTSVGTRHLDWNFVSSSAERLPEVRREWERGPRAGSPRFSPIPGDDGEFISLPTQGVSG